MKVVSDKWLETPQTYFPEPEEDHIYGTMDMRVFLQDEVWVNIAGHVFNLEDMSDDYLSNVIDMFMDDENASRYQQQMLLWYATGMLLFISEQVQPTPQERISFLDEAEAIVDLPPKEWIANTILMKRIVEILVERAFSETVPGKITNNE